MNSRSNFKLPKEHVLALHNHIADEIGGSRGVRDNGALESALAVPFQSFGGQELYSSVVEKAARLCFGLIKNHPFIDGNKRIGAHVLVIFLHLHGIVLQYTDEDFQDIILALASGDADYNGLLNWIRGRK